MFLESYKSALSVIVKKPLKLWGLSLLTVLLCVLANVFSAAFPALGIAFGFVVNCGMAKVYIDGLEGKDVSADCLFSGFSRFFRVAGGMAWQYLWTIIWALAVAGAAGLVMVVFSCLALALPFIVFLGIFLAAVVGIAGIVFYTMKIYSYRFVPYILITQPEVTATQALKLSMEMTNGRKLQMFLADLVWMAAVAAGVIILSLFAMIPYLGALFALALAAVYIAVMAISPLFTGLYGAYFYVDALKSRS